MYVTLKQLQRKHESPQRSKTRCNLLQNTCVAPINKDTSKKFKGIVFFEYEYKYIIVIYFGPS